MSWCRYQLAFPADMSHDPVVAFVRSLTVRSRGGWLFRPAPLVFEMSASSAGTSWSIDVPEVQHRPVVDLLHTHLPAVRVEAADPTEHPVEGLAVEIGLSHQARSLRTNIAAEVASGLLGVTGDLRGDERVRVQWLLGPALPRKVAKPVPNTSGSTWGGRFVSVSDSEEARARNLKQTEPVFGALGRIAVAASTRGRREHLVKGVLSMLRLTSQPSVHLLVRRIPNRLVLHRMNARSVPLVDWPCVLNAAEVAALVAWPIGGPVAAGVSYTGHRELPFSETQVFPAGPSGRRLVGKATFPGRNGPVALDIADALQHLHVVGPTGVGKSTLLANLITQDIDAGRSVVVIDPKGDLVNDVADRIPQQRTDEVVILDPADEQRPVGVNPLAVSGQSVETAVDGLVHLFRSTFAASWGPRTQDVMHAGLISLARTPGMTMVELPALLGDSRFRSQVTKPLMGDVVLGPFWGWFNSLSEAERTQVISPVLNKVRAYSMRTGLRRILGQPDPAFSLGDLFYRRRVLLVPLRRGVIGPETANLLGALVLSQLWQATQKRATIPPEKRHPVMVYLDEFQEYLHLPTDLADVLAQARSLGLGLTLAHQHLGQIRSPEVRSAVMQNARSRIVFQTGIDDAATLAKNLGGGLEPADLVNLGRFETYARLLSHGASTAPGSMTTYPLSSPTNSGGSVRARSGELYGRPAHEVDAAMATRIKVAGSGESGGRRRRQP